MDTTCYNCKFWKMLVADSNLGQCDRLTARLMNGGPTVLLRPFPGGKIGLRQDDTDTTLVTHRDFGCIKFEQFKK